jgi:hypothetical protein
MTRTGASTTVVLGVADVEGAAMSIERNKQLARAAIEI